MAKIFYKSLLIISVALAALLLLQIWFEPFTWLTFAKIIGSLVILAVLAAIALGLRHDVEEESEHKKDKLIN